MVPYTAKEKILLAQLVGDNPVIENKRTDGASLSDKKAAWVVIANAFNAEPDCTTPRTVEQLRKLWSNLKQRKRKETTDARHQLLTTGGGPLIKTELDPLLQDATEAAPVMDVSMDCPWDSNSVYETELTNSASCSSMQVPDAGNFGFRCHTKQQADLHALKMKICEAQLQERQISLKKAEAELQKALYEAELARLKLEDYKKKML